MSILIKGDRLYLRTTEERDIADYERWNNPTMKAWQTDGPWFNDDLTALINSRKKWLSGEQNPPSRFLEIDVADGVHIGWVVVYHDMSDPHMTEIGIDIVEEAYWNKGLGYDAFRIWIDYLFRERSFTRLGFSTWSGNHGMIRVGEKLGFKEEARIRNGCEVNNIFYDRIKMGLLRDEWNAIQKQSN